MALSYYAIYNKRDPEIKKAQVIDIENIIKKLTETQSVRDGILMLINNYLDKGKYFANTHSTSIDIIFSEVFEGIGTIPEAKVKNKGTCYKKVLYYCELSQMEMNTGSKFTIEELYSIEEIIDVIFRREFGDYNGKSCKKNKHLIAVVSKQEEKIEKIKMKYLDYILKRNDINDIQKVILAEKINVAGRKRKLKNYLIIPSTKLKIEKVALERVLDELIDKFEYKFQQTSYLTAEKKFEMLEEFYSNGLKNIIEGYLKELNSLEKVRERMMINTNFWKRIIKKYNIKKPDKIFSQERYILDSLEELEIDNFFHEYDIQHIKYNYEKHKSIHSFNYDPTNLIKRYEPDWIVNGNIIVEYFGYLDMETKLYTNKTIDKIRYYRQLKDYYFVDIYRENLKQLENVLRIIKKFM